MIKCYEEKDGARLENLPLLIDDSGMLRALKKLGTYLGISIKLKEFVEFHVFFYRFGISSGPCRQRGETSGHAKLYNENHPIFMFNPITF